MSTTHGLNLTPSGLPRSLAVRLSVYFTIALFAGQAFIGIAGLGNGGGWIIAVLACEVFCVFWMARHREWLPSWAFPLRSVDRSSQEFKIVSVSSDAMGVSLTEASEAESVMLRRLLNGTSATGMSFVMHGPSKEVLAVLLSRDEYELLTSAAMIARDPERLEELLHEPADMGFNVESVEEAFGIGGR
ncbi:MAG: hypothetical protein EXR07_05115 [Acetobacteraceae bacterium]|nr:hypothetical protein [Acetobacteraceae bacterium]